MARRRFVVAMMMHETNTFSPVPTPLASFRPLSGQAAIEEFRDTNTQLGGFLHVAQEAEAEVVLPVAGGAHPSGYVEQSAYEDMADAIVGAVRGATARTRRSSSPSPSSRCSATIAPWRARRMASHPPRTAPTMASAMSSYALFST